MPSSPNPMQSELTIRLKMRAVIKANGMEWNERANGHLSVLSHSFSFRWIRFLRDVSTARVAESAEHRLRHAHQPRAQVDRLGGFLRHLQLRDGWTVHGQAEATPTGNNLVIVF